MIADPHARAVIATCTRDGSTSWQNVANMLGISRETAMRLYGPMDPVISMTPDNIGPVDSLPEPESYRSTRVRTSLRLDLLGILVRRSSTVISMAGATGRTDATVRDALAQMRRDGLAISDGMGRFAQPATWFITDSGRELLAQERSNRPRRAA